MITIFPLLSDELDSGRDAVVAVVTKTWGSSPRRAGSLMLVRENGSFEGSVSGGCVEGTVIAEAQALLASGQMSKKLTFSVSNDDAFAVGLACGGTISISLFRLTRDDSTAAHQVLAALAARESASVSFSYEDGGLCFDPKPVPCLTDTPAMLGLPVHPGLRLDIIGAVHIAQALAPMAARCGFDVTVIDPRASFTEARTFEGATVVNDWPDDYFAQTSPDASTAVVTLTHDPKLDDAALLPALESDAFYIGCLGSKKTHASRVARMSDHGHGADTVARLHGPIGLDIGASTPEEIAVSILAEIIQLHRKGARHAV